MTDIDDTFPTCAICGTPNVEDAGDHADNYGHWPRSVRGLLEEIAQPFIGGSLDCRRGSLAQQIAGAILADPRVTVTANTVTVS